jgi:hypothetical protein
MNPLAEPLGGRLQFISAHEPLIEHGGCAAAHWMQPKGALPIAGASFYFAMHVFRHADIEDTREQAGLVGRRTCSFLAWAVRRWSHTAGSRSSTMLLLYSIAGVYGI